MYAFRDEQKSNFEHNARTKHRCNIVLQRIPRRVIIAAPSLRETLNTWATGTAYDKRTSFAYVDNKSAQRQSQRHHYDVWKVLKRKLPLQKKIQPYENTHTCFVNAVSWNIFIFLGTKTPLVFSSSVCSHRISLIHSYRFCCDTEIAKVHNDNRKGIIDVFGNSGTNSSALNEFHNAKECPIPFGTTKDRLRVSLRRNTEVPGSDSDITISFNTAGHGATKVRK